MKISKRDTSLHLLTPVFDCLVCSPFYDFFIERSWLVYCTRENKFYTMLKSIL